MFAVVKPLALILLTLWMVIFIPALAEGAKPAATTIDDINIPLDELDIMAAPLTVDELKIEADAWLRLVKGLAHNVADAKLRIKHQNEKQLTAEVKAEKALNKNEGKQAPSSHIEKEVTREEDIAKKADKSKDSAMDDLTSLRAERTALIDRLNIILERMNKKIGLDKVAQEKEEVQVYRRYINDVGGIKLDTSDVESAFASIKGWFTSEQGGLHWARNIGSFFSIIIVFWVLARLLSKATQKGLKLVSSQSQLFSDFIVLMTFRLVMFAGLIVGLSALEVNMGPLLALIGAAGFIVAFALQNTLSNFASGMMIMIYRPFDVNDIVEVAGIKGRVSSLNLVSTTITAFDNKRMVIPNNDIWGNIITNSTASKERRVDMLFSISYADDVDHAIEVLEGIVAAHPLILNDPAPIIKLHELTDSSVKYICRPWTKTSDYWAVYWDITRSVKVRFDAENLSKPYPQREIHIYQEQKNGA